MIEDFTNFVVSTPYQYPTQADYDQIPEDFKYLTEIKALSSMVVYNFKSFKGEHYIGPFLKFTSIVGHNGSGKSNILDAILFCLSGDKLKGMSFEPKEYIHRAESQSYHDISKKQRTCWVQLSFQLKTSSSSLKVRRTVNFKNESIYYINSQQITRQGYVSFLRSKSLIANEVCNFAIWQGSTQTLLQKDPNRLRHQFEILSGSIYVKEQYDKLMKQYNQVLKKIKIYGAQKDKIKGDKKQAKLLKTANEEYKKAEDKFKVIKEKIVITEMLKKQIEVRDLQDEIEKAEVSEKEKLIEYNKKKAEVQNNFKLSIELKKQMRDFTIELAQLNQKLKTINSQNLIFKEQTVKDLKQQLQKDSEKLETLEYKKQSIEQKLPTLQSTELITEYLQMFNSWDKQNLIQRQVFQKKQQNLATLDRLIDSKQTLIESLKEKNKKYDFDKQEQSKRLKQSQKQLDSVENMIKQSKLKLENFMKEYSRAQKKIKSKYDELTQCSKQIESLEFKLTSGIEDTKERQVTRKLSNVKGYLGLLTDKIKSNRSQYTLSVGAIFSSLEKYILVEDEEASVEIAAKLKQLGRSRTVVILSNTKNITISFEQFRKQLGDKAIPAFDAISYERQIDKLDDFLEDYLKGKVICKNLDDAFDIKHKKIRGVKQIYTYDGDVIYMSGMISSNGSTQNKNKYQKFDSTVQKTIQTSLKKAKQNYQKIKTEMKQLKTQYKESEKTKRQEEIQLLLKKKQEIEAQVQRWKTYKPNTKRMQNIVIFQKELIDLKDKRDKMNGSITQTEKQIEKSPVFKEFMKRNKIQSVQCFRNTHNLQELQKSFHLKNSLTKELVQIEYQITRLNAKNLPTKLQKAEEQVKKASNNQYKKQLQKQIREKEKQIQTIKQRVSKLKTVFNEPFSSHIPELQEKRNIVLRSLKGLLENLNLQHQTELNEDGLDFDMVFKQVKSSMDFISLNRLNTYIEKLNEQKLEKIQLMEKYISFSLVSNSNSSENIEQFDNQITNVEKDLDDFQKLKQNLSEQLSRKDTQRKNTFLKYLSEFRNLLIKIYAYVTSNTANRSTGTAQIYLDDQNNPFSSGLYFIPTPPSKRFVYDVQQLSGGQKSMASLAFVYSVALVSRAPFILLDEVDAFLDVKNLVRMRRLLQKARDEGHIQCLAISHKSGVFENSESLVGLTNYKIEQTSNSYSLLL